MMKQDGLSNHIHGRGRAFARSTAAQAEAIWTLMSGEY
jgi:hypothetical protein